MLVATLIVSAGIAPAEEQPNTVLKAEHFDRDPGWGGFNNRVTPDKVPAVVQDTGFRGVLPRRWVVERTFAWLGQNRRRSKDFERRCSTGEALIYVAMSRLMVRRLARA